jgi:dihydropteroate synthase type 2
VTSKLLGIVNITEDSFSDGGRFLSPDAALDHARALARDADILDLGAASSNPDAKPVAADMQIARLAPVVDTLKRDCRRISIDSSAPEVQRWALAQSVDYLNDIRGFPHPEIYSQIARANAKLIVMHSVQQDVRASRVEIAPDRILDRVLAFFEARVASLTAAGIARDRIVLDPGMGFFLGANPLASLTILKQLSVLKSTFGLPILVSVSRKSFLRKITGREPQEAGPASLAAELFAIRQGADYIRTHDPAAVKDALAVEKALDGAKGQA